MTYASADELVAALAALASAQNLRGRAFEGCGRWLRDGAENGLGGWSADEIEPRFASCSLVFAHGLLGRPFVDTRLDLCVRDPSGVCAGGSRPVGYYRLITRLDGTDEDDYFVIDVHKPAG